MNKKLLITAFTASVISFTNSYADEVTTMEKCKVVNSKGENIIKAHKAECASKDSSCAGRNEAGDDKAWILVPTGKCDEINKGNYSGVPEEILDKIDLDKAKK